jgi:imidazolonepropionase-like amidohydrolase
MSKFLAAGYSLADVVRMTTSNAAQMLGMEGEIGALAVGRVADLTVLDVVPASGSSRTRGARPSTGRKPSFRCRPSAPGR